MKPMTHTAKAMVAPESARIERMKRLRGVLMLKGNRRGAEAVVRGAAALRQEQGHANPYASRCEAIEKLYPLVEVRTVKKSGQATQVPIPMTASRQLGTALRFVRAVVLQLQGGKGGSEYGSVPKSYQRLAACRRDTLQEKGPAWSRRVNQQRAAVGAIGSLRHFLFIG